MNKLYTELLEIQLAYFSNEDENRNLITNE